MLNVKDKQSININTNEYYYNKIIDYIVLIKIFQNFSLTKLKL